MKKETKSTEQIAVKKTTEGEGKKLKPKKRRFFWRILTFFIFALLVLGLLGVAGFFWITKDLPRPKIFTESEMTQSTKIYDRTGTILLSNVFTEEKRTYVALAQIPTNLQKAVIATEDSRFYQHFGIDPTGLLRTVVTNLVKGEAKGASTITQQLIRSTFLTPDKTINRKVKEIILSLELDRQYSKDQILEWYLNQVPFGVNIYGVEEASLTYFQKPIQDINLSEAAMLAAIIQLPSYYSPYGQNMDKLLVRKNFVLQRMREEGYITSEQEEAAAVVKIKISKLPNTTLAYHFVTYVKQQIVGCLFPSDGISRITLKVNPVIKKLF